MKATDFWWWRARDSFSSEALGHWHQLKERVLGCTDVLAGTWKAQRFLTRRSCFSALGNNDYQKLGSKINFSPGSDWLGLGGDRSLPSSVA